MKWTTAALAVAVLMALAIATAVAEGEIWEEDDHEVLIRSERGAKQNRGGSGTYRYHVKAVAAQRRGRRTQARRNYNHGNAGADPCRYTKGPWTECDTKTNMRSRTLTLKKGDQATCEQTKTIQKKCKKACRYEKGAWSACSAQNQMTRQDALKAESDPSCEQTRQISKKCKTATSNGGKAAKKNKGGRRNRQ